MPNQPTREEIPSTVLKLSSYYFLNAPQSGRFDFSGIAMSGANSGFVVQDKSSQIFEISLLPQGQATLKPVVDLASLLPANYHPFDLESVRFLSSTTLLITNEGRQEIIQWHRTQRVAQLLLPNLGADLQKLDFNQTYGLEALCVEEHSLLLIKEQKPTITVRVDISTGDFLNKSTLVVNPPDSDVTDCVFSGGNLFLLNRNHRRILLAQPNPQGVTVFAAWDFSWIEQDKRFAYWSKDGMGKQRDDWGVAEALDVDDQYIYVGMDNNGQPLKSDPTERRPLLMVFHRPSR